MKTRIGIALVTISLILFLSGCVAAIGNRGTGGSGGTLGQQLVDLQTAKDVGAITEEEFQSEKAKLLGDKRGRLTNR